MKNDIFFILLVIVAGLAGVFYTNRSNDDILIDAQRKILEERNEQREKIEFQKNRKPVGSALDGFSYSKPSVPSINNDYERVLREIEADQPDNVVDSKIDEKENWHKLFGSWQLALMDSVTEQSGIALALSKKSCSIELQYSDKKNIILTLDRITTVKVKKNALTIRSNIGKIDISAVKDVFLLEETTKQLIDYCSDLVD